ARMTKMIDGRIRGDAAKPRAAIPPGRVEARVGPVHAPESLHGQILGHRGVADDTHEPAINLALVLPEQRFKGIHIARRESLQQFHAPPLSTLTAREAPRLHYFLPPPLLSSGLLLPLLWNRVSIGACR